MGAISSSIPPRWALAASAIRARPGHSPWALHGYVYGYKVHVLLDRAARLPLFFLLSPANRNDLPFAYPLLWIGRFLLALPIHIVRADGADWGKEIVHFIVTVIGAHPIIAFNRKKQPLARVRHLVYWPHSYLAWAGVPFGPERFFAGAKRSYWPGYLRLPQLGCRPSPRDPDRLLAQYLPIQEAV